MKHTMLAALYPMRARLFIFASALLCLGLAACADERPQSTFTKGLDTGITASDGGGTRTLANQPNVGITTRVSPY